MPVFFGHCTERSRVEVRRVVHEYVESAGALEDLLRHALELGSSAHIGAGGECGARAAPVQLCGEVLGIGRGVVIMNDDVRSGLVQRARYDSADASGCTRHEGPPAVQGLLSFGTRHVAACDSL